MTLKPLATDNLVNQNIRDYIFSECFKERSPIELVWILWYPVWTIPSATRVWEKYAQTGVGISRLEEDFPAVIRNRSISALQKCSSWNTKILLPCWLVSREETTGPSGEVRRSITYRQNHENDIKSCKGQNVPYFAYKRFTWYCSAQDGVRKRYRTNGLNNRRNSQTQKECRRRFKSPTNILKHFMKPIKSKSNTSFSRRNQT